MSKQNTIYISTDKLPAYLNYIATKHPLVNLKTISTAEHNRLWLLYVQHLDDEEIDTDSNDYREKFNRN